MFTFKLTETSITLTNLRDHFIREGYSVAIVGFYTTYMTHNITKEENKFSIQTDTNALIPEISLDKYSLRDFRENRLLKDSVLSFRAGKHNYRSGTSFKTESFMKLDLGPPCLSVGFSNEKHHRKR
jgi:hypothetical protein